MSKDTNIVNTRKIESIMILEDLTQRDLAAELGIAPQTVNAKLRRRKEFNLVEVYKIANLFGVTVDELLIPIDDV